jgi:hypothetical protein
MSISNGTDRMRQQQLRAVAENLYTLANRHRENGNYVVAHALYGRALTVAQWMDTRERDEHGNALVTRIQKDRQTVFEMLRSGDDNPENVPLARVQKLGQ